MARLAGQLTLTSAEKARIATRYANGETIRDLRIEYHRTRQTIKDVIVAAGVEIRLPGYGKGREWTPEWRAAHHAATHTPDFREKSRKALLGRLPSMRGPAINTPIEQRLHDALKQAGIGFTTQSLLLNRYLVDIQVHQAPVVVEADGTQHALRDRKAQDAERDAALTAAGYRVIRFTGSEINRDATNCVRRLIDACGLIRDREPVYDIRTRFAGPAHPNWNGGDADFTCDACGASFTKRPSHRQFQRTFCNQKCYGKWLHEHPEMAASKRVQRDWTGLAELYADGMSLKQLAKHFDCGTTAIRTAMREHDIAIRSIGGARTPGGAYQAIRSAKS